MNKKNKKSGKINKIKCRIKERMQTLNIKNEREIIIITSDIKNIIKEFYEQVMPTTNLSIQMEKMNV